MPSTYQFQRLHNGPPASEAGGDCAFANAGPFSPLSNIHSQSFCGVQALTGWLGTFAAVVVLLFGSCPTTIAWFVMAVVVDSIQGMFGGRSWSWIHHEFFKRCEEESNASTAIIVPSTIIRVGASVFSLMVSTVFRRTFPTVFAARFTPGDSNLAPQTSTGFRCSSLQDGAIKCFFSAATTTANPFECGTPIGFNDCPTPILMTC